MADQLVQRLRAHGLSITLLVGENGSGKSRRLANLTKEALKGNLNVMAVANTVFDRFPRVRNQRYTRLSPSLGRRYAIEVFKRALTFGHLESFRNSSQIGKCLNYTGFEPVIGLHVRRGPEQNPEDVYRHLEREIPPEDLSTIQRALKIYARYPHSERQTAWIDMYGESIHGPDRRELFELLKHEKRLKRLGLIANISLTLTKNRSVYDLDQASSGELSLLATYAYIATHIEEESILLIDEPENSLHPRWQREYCNRLLDQFHYYAPKIVIATHSPLIVEGARSADVDVQVMRMPENHMPAMQTNSIEATLFEVFGILSPASHYLSEKVSFILNELAQNRQSLEATNQELIELENMSVDSEQKTFLAKARDLAKEIKQSLDSKRGSQT